MYPATCKTVGAESLEDAASLVEQYGPGAHVLAGGQSLIPLMKLRLAQPEVLVDISHLHPEPVHVGDDHVRIHALTTHAAIGAAPELTERFDIFADVVPQIADPQVRNMGTIGGALAEADPGNDWGPVITATGGVITAVSPTGRRDIPVDDFFDGPFTTALDSNELIESVTVPIPDPRTGGAYVKAKRRQGGYGVASVGVQATLDPDGVCTSFGFCCADDVSAYVAPREVTELVEGAEIDEELVASCIELVTEAVDPVSDTRGTVAFKRNLCGVLFDRAMDAATRRARGETVEDPMKPAGGTHDE